MIVRVCLSDASLSLMALGHSTYNPPSDDYTGEPLLCPHCESLEIVSVLPTTTKLKLLHVSFNILVESPAAPRSCYVMDLSRIVNLIRSSSVFSTLNSHLSTMFSRVHFHIFSHYTRKGLYIMVYTG